METIKLYFEEKAEELLERRGLTKTQFARKMGVRKQNLNALFATKNVVQLQKAANVLGVPLELLISFTKEMPFADDAHFYSNYLDKARYLRVIFPYIRYEQRFPLSSDEYFLTEDYEPLVCYDEKNYQYDFVIDIENRKICDWNYDSEDRIIYHDYCEGTYIMLDENKQPLLQMTTFNPEGLVPVKDDDGYKYPYIVISKEGVIENWPEEFDLIVFAESGKQPGPVPSNKWARARRALFEIENSILTDEERRWIKENLK